MLNFGRFSGPAYDLVGVGVIVGVAEGGSGVFEGVNVCNNPGGVVVGLSQAGGNVCVGKISALVVIVGLNSAVMVRSGVGNANGVGEAIKGKLHASVVRAINPIARSGKRILFLMLTSLTPILFDLIHQNYDHFEIMSVEILYYKRHMLN